MLPSSWALITHQVLQTQVLWQLLNLTLFVVTLEMFSVGQGLTEMTLGL